MDVRDTRYQQLAQYLAKRMGNEEMQLSLAQGLYDFQVEQAQHIQTKYEEVDSKYLVRVSLPMDLYGRLTSTIGPRVLHLVGEQYRNTVCSKRGLFRAMKQAKREALREALEDWLQKPKDEKWF